MDRDRLLGFSQRDAVQQRGDQDAGVGPALPAPFPRAPTRPGPGGRVSPPRRLEASGIPPSGGSSARAPCRTGADRARAKRSVRAPTEAKRR
jgi:hypothetical protein